MLGLFVALFSILITIVGCSEENPQRYRYQSESSSSSDGSTDEDGLAEGDEDEGSEGSDDGKEKPGSSKAPELTSSGQSLYTVVCKESKSIFGSKKSDLYKAICSGSSVTSNFKAVVERAYKGSGTPYAKKITLKSNAADTTGVIMSAYRVKVKPLTMVKNAQGLYDYSNRKIKGSKLTTIESSKVTQKKSAFSSKKKTLHSFDYEIQQKVELGAIKVDVKLDMTTSFHKLDDEGYAIVEVGEMLEDKSPGIKAAVYTRQTEIMIYDAKSGATTVVKVISVKSKNSGQSKIAEDTIVSSNSHHVKWNYGFYQKLK